MSTLDDSKLIFEQLANCDAAAGGGVHTLIENHDAWSHNTATLAQLSCAVRTHFANAQRPRQVALRIGLQQSRLQSLAIALPRKIPAAG